MADLFFLITGAMAVLFWGLFCLTSVREKKPRATVLSGIVCLATGSLWFGGYLIWDPPDSLLYALTGAVVLLAALFFPPLGKVHTLFCNEITERVDERDIMFAREEYLPGSSKYEAYYARRPELKQIDDKIRALPEWLAPGGKYYDPLSCSYTASIFEVIEGLLTEVDGAVAPARVVDVHDEHSDDNNRGADNTRDNAKTGGAGQSISAKTMTMTLKELAMNLGAAEVGIARLNPAFVYSHVGRGPEPWGEPIVNTHRYAIAFTLEMDYQQVEAAPRIPITAESAKQYLRGALISLALATYIRQLGYPARAHIAGSNYQIMVPPVAHDAGLGELGRFGYLISRKIGARVRLGAVTTDLPLVPDAPAVFGVQEFCELCKRCAVNCPSGAIPAGARTVVRGVAKWPLKVESCLQYWRHIGTDCGLCMKVCPYSHPRTLVHDLVRFGISRSAFARRLAVLGEDLFYGRRV